MIAGTALRAGACCFGLVEARFYVACCVVEVPMTTPANRKMRSASCLVLHDLHLTRVQSEQGRPQVVASVRCERQGCEVSVEACARCVHFARIEPHEAGYVLLCREHDETMEVAIGEEPCEPGDS
jgi:hypothetical protein